MLPNSRIIRDHSTYAFLNLIVRLEKCREDIYSITHSPVYRAFLQSKSFMEQLICAQNYARHRRGRAIK